MSEEKPMTVGKMIEHLNRFPKDTMLLVQGYEGGYQFPLPPISKLVKKVNNSWFYGPYEFNDDGIDAVIIARDEDD